MKKKEVERLERLYHRYNHRRFVHPDPLEFLYDYGDAGEREVVALLASSLAYGRVARILASVSAVLSVMEGAPLAYLSRAGHASCRKDFGGFVHRFARGEHVASLLMGIRGVLEREGSLRRCFAGALEEGDGSLLSAMNHFAGRISREGRDGAGHLMPLPSRGSACKRLNLFLRWMVRRDRVDPGGWDEVPPSKLIVPLDTHMHRIGLHLGLTSRKQADMRTALEITAGFGRVSPEDPVRYDFALTRLGIREEGEMEAFLAGGRF